MMKIKPHKQTFLHDLRRQEAEIIFGNCPEMAFDNTLELGAGDGFLSQILARYTKKLLCTEINKDRLNILDLPNVQYKILDAEKVGESFEAQSFDFIFSSNLLEHLPNVDKTLAGIHRVLTDDGIAIHVLPNRTWKISTILFFWPNKIISTIDKFLAGRLFKRRPGHKFGQVYKTKYGGNNQKIGRKKQSRLTKLFLPPIHGISNNTLEEFYAFGKNPWIRRFQNAGFDILATKKMPFNSGYGFGFKRIKSLMETLGFSSATTFITFKKGSKTKYETI